MTSLSKGNVRFRTQSRIDPLRKLQISSLKMSSGETKKKLPDSRMSEKSLGDQRVIKKLISPAEASHDALNGSFQNLSISSEVKKSKRKAKRKKKKSSIEKDSNSELADSASFSFCRKCARDFHSEHALLDHVRTFLKKERSNDHHDVFLDIVSTKVSFPDLGSTEASHKLSEAFPSTQTVASSITVKPMIRTLYSNSNSERLSQELGQFADSYLPSKEDMTRRTNLLYRLECMISTLFNNNVRVDLFGSCAANLSSKTSDLDICLSLLQFSKKKSQRDTEHLEILLKLHKALEEEGSGRSEAILSARVPIVKFRDDKTGIECDFAIRVGNHALKSQLLALCCEIDHRFRPLVLAAKHWSKVRHVGDATKGTLNSFGHSMLMIHYLQNLDEAVLPLFVVKDEHSWDMNLINSFQTKNTLSIGDLLLQYFKYYAIRFDPSKHCISVHSLGFELLDETAREEKFQKRHRTSFCVEDPVDPTDNIGRNLTDKASTFIKDEFILAYLKLSRGDPLSEIFEVPTEVPILRDTPRRNRRKPHGPKSGRNSNFARKTKNGNS